MPGRQSKRIRRSQAALGGGVSVPSTAQTLVPVKAPASARASDTASDRDQQGRHHSNSRSRRRKRRPPHSRGMDRRSRYLSHIKVNYTGSCLVVSYKIVYLFLLHCEHRWYSQRMLASESARESVARLVRAIEMAKVTELELAADSGRPSRLRPTKHCRRLKWQ